MRRLGYARWPLAFILCAATLGAPWPRLNAAEPGADLSREILPILKRACFECHGSKLRKGGLRLDTRDEALKGGDSGPAIVPRDANASELLRRVALPKDDPEVMPARGPLLSSEQVAILKRWIESGAAWPAPDGPHWAYVRPTRPAPPPVRDAAWVRTVIDRFILARLETEGLSPSPEADRATLIRRLSLDLVGLPPSPAEVDAFLADLSDDAYERLVDRLLASPQFGERWARPWLDLARYADSHGFQKDDLRDLWPYRDWVIAALNADMPFDQFSIEQVAGDLLPEAGESQRVATGLHRCAATNVEAGSEPEETRVNQVFDRVNTTAAIWLGTTLECAQCHDHKYDPFTQRDYYRLFAFFNSTATEAERSDPKAPGSIKFLGPSLTLRDAALEAERSGLQAEIQRVEGLLTRRREEFADNAAAQERALAAAEKSAPRTHVLEAASFESSAGSPYKVLEDHSILLVDDPPDRDTYTVTVHTNLMGIKGFKLEALTDPQIAGSGPGRGDTERPEFVLNSFAVRMTTGDQAGEFQPVRLANAKASFSRKNYDVAGAIDDNPNTAWSIHPRYRESHWATFETVEPLGEVNGTTLEFKLVQDSGGGRTIGRLKLSAIVGDLGAPTAPKEVALALQVPVDQRTPEQIRQILDYELEFDLPARELKDRLKKLRLDVESLKFPTTLVMRELDRPRASHLFVRGNYQEPGEPIEPGAPAALHRLPDGPPNRLTLARWLVSPDNPLTPRVTVNRWWAELMGRGIVSTVEDFGVKGEPPTHPELLDWLAVELQESGWSMKHILRLVVTSAAYRQSSQITPQLRARDPENKFYARAARFRLDAETIRDQALAVAGLLSLKSGGPPIRPPQPDGLWTKVGGVPVQYVTSSGDDRYRRGIYVVWKRATPYPGLANFDATQRMTCVPRRSRSNTPLQALTLLNDPVYVEAARALAQRVIAEASRASDASRIEHAFRLCLVRRPEPFEAAALVRLYEGQLAAARHDPSAVRELLGEASFPDGSSAEKLAAWYAVAAALLNLDESITRE